jgi:serine/threonine protein kinase
MADFQQRDCEVLGVNTDTLATHERWLTLPPAQNGLGGLNFPLASDDAGFMCQAYGVYMARQHRAQRALFLIDPNGVLQYQVVHSVSVGRSTDEILRVLDALQTGGICPGEWQSGQPALDLSQTLGPNSVLGQYRVEAVVGSGSFGSVLRAWDMLLERPVALKIIPTGGRAAVDSLLSEARAAAALNHPNICAIHAVDADEAAPMIIMEYVPGQPLHKLLEAGALQAREAASLGRQIADAMAAAHAHGVIHGDLKPANVMVTPDGTAKITDFGLARRLSASSRTPNSTADGSASAPISGTPRYLAPERARGEPLSPAADVFALGLMLYEMVTGRDAISAKTLAEALRYICNLDPGPYVAELPEPFAHIVGRALANDPARRDIGMPEIASLLEGQVSVGRPEVS